MVGGEGSTKCSLYTPLGIAWRAFDQPAGEDVTNSGACRIPLIYADRLLGDPRVTSILMGGDGKGR